MRTLQVLTVAIVTAVTFWAVVLGLVVIVGELI